MSLAEPSVGLDDHVVGRDVAVDDARRVHARERLHQRQQQLSRVLDAEAAAVLLHVLVQGQALDIVHHEVGRAVLLEVAVDAHDVRVPDEVRERLRLLQEQLLAVAEVLPPLAGEQLHRAGVAAAAGHVGRQILLDRDALLRLVVLGDIGHAEAALAEHAPDDVTSVQDRAGPQRERIARLLSGAVKAAEGAGPRCILFAKTVSAQAHGFSSPPPAVLRPGISLLSCYTGSRARPRTRRRPF